MSLRPVVLLKTVTHDWSVSVRRGLIVSKVTPTYNSHRHQPDVVRSLTFFNSPNQSLKRPGLKHIWRQHQMIAYRRLYSLSSFESSLSTKSNSMANASLSLNESFKVMKAPLTTSNQVSNYDPFIDLFKSFSIGTLAGFMGSLAGMGGGFVMIPLMTAPARKSVSGLWRGGLGLSQHQAHGTSLFAIVTTGLSGALGYGIRMNNDVDRAPDETNANMCDGETNSNLSEEILYQSIEESKDAKLRGLVELDTALALAATAMITARIGVMTSSFLSERGLKRCLGAFMISVAPLVFGKTYIESFTSRSKSFTSNADKFLEEDQSQRIKNDHFSYLRSLLPASIIGIFSGYLSGLFGVGGGTIVVPALVLTTDMTYHTALGTSLCAMVLPALVGTYTYARQGNVNWRVGLVLALGSSVGAYLGSREVAMHLEEDVLRGGFACLMLLLGVKTWRR